MYVYCLLGREKFCLKNQICILIQLYPFIFSFLSIPTGKEGLEPFKEPSPDGSTKGTFWLLLSSSPSLENNVSFK